MTMTNSPDIMKNIKSKLPTLLLVLVAVVVAYAVYQRWVHNPWTRHGQVRAEIVKVAPRVSGYIVEIAVRSNQFVRKGDLLFRIDPSSYQLAADGAQVRLRQAREGVAALEATVEAAGGINRPPMPVSASAALFPLAQAAIPGIDGVAVGGGSDGNFTAALGVPTLDGLGAVGGGAHADHEYVVVDTMPGRVELVEGILRRLL